MAVDIQAPQYPAPITPSFASFSARQRMEIEDALAAEQAQKERQLAVGRAGLKFGYEYDKMLRGYMEAKFANPELTYWDYVRKPAVGGAFRAEGRKKIAEHIKAGGDIDELPGMTFSERHKAGLKGFFEKDAPPPAAATTTTQTAAQPKQPLAERGSLAAAQAEIEAIEAGGPLPTSSQEAAGRELESIKRGEKISAGQTDILKQLKGLKATAEVHPGAMEYGPAGSAGPDMSKPVYDETGRKVFGGTFDELEYEQAEQFRTLDEAQKSTESASELVTSLQEARSGERNMPLWGRKWGEGEDPVGAFDKKAAAEDLALENKFKAEDLALGKRVKTEGGWKTVRKGEWRVAGTKLTDMGGKHIGDVGKAGGKPIYQNIVNLQKKGKGGKDLVNYQQIFKFTDPEGTDSYYRMAGVGGNNEVQARNPGRFISSAGHGFNQKQMDLHGMTKVNIDPSVIEAAGGESKYFKSEEFKKAFPMPEAAGETAKAGLKETLGKGAAGLGYGASVVSGAQKLAKGETTEEKIGGGLQVAGGAAGLVAMTNFWNPVGWAAAIPAALSIGGGLMGGGSDPLAKTPLGRYRRRVGIG